MLEPEVGPTKPPRRRLRARWYILAALLLPFTVLTYFAVSSGSPGDAQDRPVILTTLAAITGPFVGAIARHGQPCCLESSIQLAVLFGPAVLVGIIAQFAPLPFKRGSETVRLFLWTCGWATWFFAGFVSFLHALS